MEKATQEAIHAALPERSPLMHDFPLGKVNEAIGMNEVIGNNKLNIAKDTKGSVTVSFVCLALALIIGMVVLWFAEAVFAVQGLVVGVATIHGDNNQTLPLDTNTCSFRIGRWMIVSGALWFFLFFFNSCVKDTCCTVQSKKKPEEREANKLFHLISKSVAYVEFCVLIAGMVILYTETECENPSQFQVFSTMVQFLFYGRVAVSALAVVATLYMARIVSSQPSNATV